MKSLRLSRALESTTPDAEVPLLKRLGAVLVSFAIAGMIAPGVAIASESLPLWARAGACLFCFFVVQRVICDRIIGEQFTKMNWLINVASASLVAGVMAWLINYADQHLTP